MGKLLVKENMNFRGKTTKHVPRLSMEMTATQDHLNCESPIVKTVLLGYFGGGLGKD